MASGYDAALHLRRTMENGGYEDEFGARNIPEAAASTEERFSLTPNSRGVAMHARELFSDARSREENHIYEDVRPCPEFSSLANGARSRGVYGDNPSFDPIPEKPESLGKSASDSKDGIFNLSKNVPCLVENERRKNGEATVDVPNCLHRTSTLPTKKSQRIFDSRDRSKNRSFRVTIREKDKDYGFTDDHLFAEEPVCASQQSADAENTEISNDLEDVCRKESDRQGRRRKKKDCKYCKNKATSFEEQSQVAKITTANGNGLCNRSNGGVKMADRLQPILAPPDGRLPNFCHATAKPAGKTSSVYTLTNNANNWNQNSLKSLNYDKNEIQERLAPGDSIVSGENRALITPQKNRTTMKVNSIYSQDQWNSKDKSIFVANVDDHEHFERAYTLGSQTPSSQNRVNLRRSVRGEPPPRAARLDKHRRGWTLHFVRPLRGTGCTKSVVILLVVILVLLGVGGAALYILFEPQKLQVIQQYLMASLPNSTADCATCTTRTTRTETTNVPADDLSNATHPTSVHYETTTITLPPETTTTLPEAKVETNQSPTALNLNTTRHCDDCVSGEVCIALVNEEVPICRFGPDDQDPTGCAGLCLINTQRCHRLDIDAFRCVEIEHQCLENEWTCSNGLCIPFVKRCDGHMNCYDHSDEIGCSCDLETHFRCGNETSCLPMEKKCDGVINCWDATDEMNCIEACPSDDEFTCSNGQCISKARFCDGLADCSDASDEPHGCQGRCNKHEFTCENGRCITKAMKCNGVDDCGDGTDENHCRDRPT